MTLSPTTSCRGVSRERLYLTWYIVERHPVRTEKGYCAVDQVLESHRQLSAEHQIVGKGHGANGSVVEGDAILDTESGGIGPLGC